MIKIILNNGKEYNNDPNLGWNLNSKEDILETFDDVGYYELFTKEEGWKRIYKYDLQKII